MPGTITIGVMASSTIRCTNCGKEIEITKALLHEVEEQVQEATASAHKEDLERIRTETEKSVREKILTDVEAKLRDGKNEVNELKAQNRLRTEELLELNKSVRLLKEQEERKELEYQKRLTAALDTQREEVAKTLTEKSQLEVLELRKQLEDTKKSLDDAKNKLAQKSQQLQGEVVELNIEDKLRSAFIYDEIDAVAKGVNGADIIQKVRNQAGKVAGTILWETKRAKWSNGWLSKLREDGRNAGATIIVLVVEHTSDDVEGFGLREGVVVTTYAYLLPLAELLRRAVMQVASAKSVAANKDEKLEFLYQYIASDTFRFRFEAYAETIREMEEDLATERRSMERIWKKRELQIRRSLDNMAKMYGELQGIMGSSLPEIRTFTLPGSNEDISEAEQKTLGID